MGNEELRGVRQGERGPAAGGPHSSPPRAGAGQYVPPQPGVSVRSSAHPEDPQPASTAR